MKALSPVLLAIAVLVGASSIPVAANAASVLTIENTSHHRIHLTIHLGGVENAWLAPGEKLVRNFPNKVWGIVYASIKATSDPSSPDKCLASHAITIEDGHTTNLFYVFGSRRILDTQHFEDYCTL
jgi:hypothetical protein